MIRVVLLLIPVGLYWILALTTNLEPSAIQFIVFPFATALLFYVLSHRLFWSVLGLLLFSPALVWGVLSTFSSSADAGFDGVILARLQKDPQESQSILLREQIKRFHKKRWAPRLERYHSKMRSHRMALRSFPRSEAIVWGDPKTVRLSFRPIGRKFTHKIGLARGRKVKTFELIDYIPGILLSYNPVPHTGYFIASLLSAEHIRKLDEGRFTSQQEEAYLDAAIHESQWRSHAHLALPWFRLGNGRLSDAQSTSSSVGPESYSCAMDAYTQAASLLQPGDHPLLRAAIFNNKGIGYLLSASSRSDKTALKNARSMFQKALLISKRRGAWKPSGYVTKAIKHNMKAFKALIRKKK